MTTQFNGRGFQTETPRTFAPVFEGAQSRRERSVHGIMPRRNIRRERRANRAI